MFLFITNQEQMEVLKENHIKMLWIKWKINLIFENQRKFWNPSQFIMRVFNLIKDPTVWLKRKILKLKVTYKQQKVPRQRWLEWIWKNVFQIQTHRLNLIHLKFILLLPIYIKAHLSAQTWIQMKVENERKQSVTLKYLNDQRM